jgi:hypothetical protein
MDIYTVKELMGHAVFSVTQRYAHLAPACRTAVDTLVVPASVAKSVAAAPAVSARIQ